MKVVAAKDFYYLVVIGLVSLIGLVSSSKFKDLVVRTIGFIAYCFSRIKRKLIERNVSLAFEGQLSQQKLRNITIGALHGVWEEMLSWLPSDAKRSGVDQVRIHGMEQLREALEKGKGIILWESNGFGIRILAKKVLHANGFSVCQVHGVDNLGGFLTDDSEGTWVRSKWIKRFFDRCERHFVYAIINLPRADSFAAARRLKNILKQNRIVCVSGDGKMGHKLMSFDFLGHNEFFATGMVSLAKLSGATILPMFCIRERDGERHLFIESPIPVHPDGDRESGFRMSLSRYVSLMESYIRAHPEQYRNWHILGDQPLNLHSLNG
ncbi:MAG: lysophospholipid acyltransferase family protein [Gammaproteobacteria bacterium]|nr:lysophospholipid acyltransferase family protein [Gammaproteobacteria bacterium]